MKIRWTRSAAKDLADIAGFIAEDNPLAAEALVQKIKISLKKATHFPRSGRIVPEFGDETIREILVGHYRIVYRLDAKVIDILTVFEGHRLMPVITPAGKK